MKKLVTALTLLALFITSHHDRCRADEPLAPRAAMEHALAPLVEQYCIDCHSGDEAEAGLRLDKLLAEPSVLSQRRAWQRVVERVHAKEMPPEEGEQPTDEQRQTIVDWLTAELNSLDCDGPVSPGRVTVRRLNRTEFVNTIRDLTGVEYDAAAVFPRDELGYGFDNIGDVLTLSPLLMEKYLYAAREIAEQAITTPELLVEPRQEFAPEDLSGGNDEAHGTRVLATNGQVGVDVEHPASGEYVLRARVFASQAREGLSAVYMNVDDHRIKAVSVAATEGDPQTLVARYRADAGRRRVAVEFYNDLFTPDEPNPEQRDRNVYVISLAVVGPLKDTEADQQRPLDELVRRFTPETDWTLTDDWRQPLREFLRELLLRGYRRPAEESELSRLLGLVSAAREGGASFERAAQLALQAVLASPEFLFRGEADRREGDQPRIRELDDYELATRISYFLTSSMPDKELFSAAAAGTVRRELDRHVDRLLASPRSDELVRNFGEQWLETRQLIDQRPDPAMFPDYNTELADDLRQETFLFLRDLLRNNRPLPLLLSADYSYINDRLAKHYGLDPPSGSDFVRQELPESRKAGVLTHGSVLTVSSYEYRTSPVLRGKWVLEHLLNDPPPPPPPGVSDLADPPAGQPHESLRERLEQHRHDATCASCHKRMDPLGFALDHFDPVGRYRERDGGDAVDARAQLPDGREFTGATGLRDVLMEDFDRVRHSLAEHLLTYALGRGLEYYDQCAVDGIVAQTTEGGDALASMIRAIVHSPPFLMRDERLRRDERVPPQ